MKAVAVVTALAALAHEHRLALYRLLLARGSEGLAAGRIAERLGIAASSLSFHLQNLQRAGLITRRRASRQLIYAVDFAAMDALLAYLRQNCCAESGEACAPGCAPALPGRNVRRRSQAA